MISVLIPIKAVSLNKTSGKHWGTRAKRATKHKAAVAAMLHGHKPALPCVVTMCRIAPSGGLDEHDNLRGSLKHAVDGVAVWLGLKSDDDKRVEWKYAQERGKDYAVRVTIESAA